MFFKSKSKRIKKMYSNKNDEDVCALCGKRTGYKYGDDINKRVHYIKGCGQLCQDCYFKLYEKDSKNNSDIA